MFKIMKKKKETKPIIDPETQEIFLPIRTIEDELREAGLI